LSGDQRAKPAPAKTYDAVGVVKHSTEHRGGGDFRTEAIPSLSWPPMTMGFGGQDKALQRKLFIDKKVPVQDCNDESGVY